MKYQIVKVDDPSIVERLMQQGWEPQGGVIAVPHPNAYIAPTFFQAMIKRPVVRLPEDEGEFGEFEYPEDT